MRVSITLNQKKKDKIYQAYKWLTDTLKDKILEGEIDNYNSNSIQGRMHKKKDLISWEMVKKIYNLFKKNKNIKLFHIKAHTDKQDVHSLGNEQADRLATESIGGSIGGGHKKLNKIYLNVPFAQKDVAKKLGAKWDRKKKKWFTEDNNKLKGELVKMF